MATTTKGFHYPLGTDRVVDGDDVIAQLANDIDTMAGSSACGSALCPITAPNQNTSVSVTFPAGRFNAVPLVQVTAVAGATSSVRQPTVNTVIGQTSVTLYCARDSGSAAVTLDWWAVQLP